MCQYMFFAMRNVIVYVDKNPAGAGNSDIQNEFGRFPKQGSPGNQKRFGNPAPPPSFSPNLIFEDVVVVGAGVSGLTAAHRMPRGGFFPRVTGMGAQSAIRRISRSLGSSGSPEVWTRCPKSESSRQLEGRREVASWRICGFIPDEVGRSCFDFFDRGFASGLELLLDTLGQSGGSWLELQARNLFAVLRELAQGCDCSWANESSYKAISAQ